MFLSRIQFAFTAAFHFIFVPFTIGIIFLVAIFETISHFKKSDTHRKMSDFWGELFVINFAVGIVTGLTMAIQFGTNWSRYSVFMGDVFGSPLAFEALLAFFLESTFAGIWIFKRHKISSGLRMLVTWLIALGTSISALWIITANGFMQHPTGYELTADKSKVVLTDFGAVMTNQYSLYMLTHTLLAAVLLAAFAVIGISAYHLKRGNHVELFMKSVKIAVIAGLISSILLPVQGWSYAKYIGQNDVQPLKGVILRDRVETKSQVAAPADTGSKEGKIDAQSAASLETAKNSMENLTRKPPVKAVYFMYVVMQVLGVLFILFLLILAFRSRLIQQNRLVQNLALWFIPLPYVAICLGWMVAEIGRQPWLVYNLMTVEDGISQVPVESVIFSLFAIGVLYAILFVLDFYLLKKRAVQGPVQEGGQNNVVA